MRRSVPWPVNVRFGSQHVGDSGTVGGIDHDVGTGHEPRRVLRRQAFGHRVDAHAGIEAWYGRRTPGQEVALPYSAAFRASSTPCTTATTFAPSPIAAPTRFTEQ